MAYSLYPQDLPREPGPSIPDRRAIKSDGGTQPAANRSLPKYAERPTVSSSRNVVRTALNLPAEACWSRNCRRLFRTVATRGLASIAHRFRRGCRRDADRDRDVDLADFAIVAANFDVFATGKSLADGDFNYDGRVNLRDLSILASQFNESLPPGARRDLGTAAPTTSQSPTSSPRFGVSVIDEVLRLDSLIQPFAD